MTTLFEKFAEIANIIKPKAIVLENVRLLTSMKTPDGELVTTCIIKEFSEAGYNLNFMELNAQAYGVPQSRERVIFIGIRIMIK